MRALAGESVHTCIIFVYLYLEDESFFLLSLGIISLNAFYFFAKQYSIHDSVRYLLLNYSLAGIYVGCVLRRCGGCAIVFDESERTNIQRRRSLSANHNEIVKEIATLTS